VLLDPGTHRFTLVVEGNADVTVSQTLATGSRSELTLHPSPAPRPPPPARPSAAPIRRAAAPLPDKPSRTPAFVAVGVGAAGLILGGVSGLIALGKKDDVRDACLGTNAQRCVNERDSGYRAADISSAAFSVAGASLVTGALLLYVWPGTGAPISPSRNTQVRASVRGAALSLEGRF
jgi:hypothetical protein